MNAAVEIFDLEQGSPEWFAIRLGLPTGTDFASIISPVKGDPVKGAARQTLIATLIDEIVRPDAERAFQGNRHTERGKELEPDAIGWYEMLHEIETTKAGFVRNNVLRAGVSPDRLVGKKGGLEVKCPDGKTHVIYTMDGVLPAEYKPQVHACLAVTGRAWWDFLSWCPGYKPFLVRTVRNEYTDKLELALKEFYVDFDHWKSKLIEQEE